MAGDEALGRFGLPGLVPDTPISDAVREVAALDPKLADRDTRAYVLTQLVASRDWRRGPTDIAAAVARVARHVAALGPTGPKPYWP